MDWKDVTGDEKCLGGDLVIIGRSAGAFKDFQRLVKNAKPEEAVSVITKGYFHPAFTQILRGPIGRMIIDEEVQTFEIILTSVLKFDPPLNKWSLFIPEGQKMKVGASLSSPKPQLLDVGVIQLSFVPERVIVLVPNGVGLPLFKK